MQCKYIEIGGKTNDKFIRKIIVPIQSKEATMKQYKFSDTYSTIYRYDNRNQDLANIIAPLYIDLDIDDLENNYSKLKRDMLLLIRRLKTLFHLEDNNLQIFFSGSKGFHILIPYEIFGIRPCKDLNSKYKSIATELKSYTITKSIDTKIYDSKRLFREPNTINSKTGLYKVPLTLDDIRNFTYEELIEYAKTPKNREDIVIDKTYKKKSEEAINNLIEELEERQRRSINHRVARQMLENKEMLPCVKYVLQHGANKGGRNNTAMALASALYQREPDNEEGIMDIMKIWNENKLDSPLPERELEATVQSAYRNVQAGKRYGCNAFIDLDICVKGCPVRK